MEPPFFPKPHLPMSFRFLFISSAPLLPQLIHLPPLQHSFSLTGLSTQTKTSSLHLTLQFPNCSDRQAHDGIGGPSHGYSGPVLRWEAASGHVQCGFDLLVCCSNPEKCTLVNWGVFLALRIPGIVCFLPIRLMLLRLGERGSYELRLSWRLL